jgi:hypothetical protein|nr:MAG TPA: hypothetical protein [Caudoviricetes sp.]
MLNTTGNNMKRGLQNMKDLKWLSVEDYANSPQELTVISCMKGYLRRMEPEDALRRLSEIIKPKVVSLNEGGVPMPVQSVVEGAKLAAFIDDAVSDSIKDQEQQNGVSRREIDALHEIKGQAFIQSMSVDVIQFVADAYRCLKY